MTVLPKVSIVIPVYNGANYLREAIDSALAQTYENIEVIVINDGSSDNGDTEAIARSYGDKIRYYYKSNGGVSSALNFGIEKMTGEYFSWLSHDDVYFKNKVEEQVAVLLKQENEAIAYSDFEFIGKDSEHIQTKRMQGIKPDEMRFMLMAGAPVVHGCATLVPKSCFSAIGRFDTELRVVQDVDMWLRLARNYDFIHVPKVLIKSRLHPDQGTENLSPEQVRENMVFINKYFDEIDREANDDAVAYLLKSAVTLHRSSFPDAASYAYALAWKKVVDKPILGIIHFRYLALSWITRKHCWRCLRLFTAVPYRMIRGWIASMKRA